MAAKPAHDSRPGIEPGQLLPLPEFMFRARISRSVWQAMRTSAEENGHQLALRVGSKSFIDTTAFLEFLKTSTAKKLKLMTGGAS